MNVRAQIKYWLSIKQLTYEKLAEKMTERSGKKYTLGSLNGKLIRGTLTVIEFNLIAKILGYKMEFKEDNSM